MVTKYDGIRKINVSYFTYDDYNEFHQVSHCQIKIQYTTTMSLVLLARAKSPDSYLYKLPHDIFKSIMEMLNECDYNITGVTYTIC